MAGGSDVLEPVQILAVIAVIFAARLAVSADTAGPPSPPLRIRLELSPVESSAVLRLYPPIDNSREPAHRRKRHFGAPPAELAGEPRSKFVGCMTQKRVSSA